MSTITSPSLEHAVVLGGSVAGLLAARVLADHCAQVTLVERDAWRDSAEPRKGVPQGRHAHAILARGLAIMDDLFPGLKQELLADGAQPLDMAADMIWYQFGDYTVRFPSDFIGLGMSRPFLEAHLARRVLALPNVRLLDETDSRGFLTTADGQRVNGVRLRARHESAEEVELRADLVIDATGRGSATPKWLEAHGFGRPEESEVRIDVGYATRVYRRQAGDLTDGKMIMLHPTPPTAQRMGVMLPIEDDRWIATIGGWGGEHAPADEAGFVAFARSLPTRDIADLMQRVQPVGDIGLFKVPSNLRRHYEKMRRFPAGLIVMGDAMCSFNPIYGQGMTTAALQALALGVTLREAAPDSAEWPRRFFQRAARHIAIPWSMAAGEDFRYPQTTGPKAPGVDFINWYMTFVHRTAQRDEEVQRCFLLAMNMMAPPTIMFRPNILWRVLKHHLTRRRQPPLTPAGQPATAVNY